MNALESIISKRSIESEFMSEGNRNVWLAYDSSFKENGLSSGDYEQTNYMRRRIEKTYLQTRAAPFLQGVLLEGRFRRPRERTGYVYGLDLRRYSLHLICYD